MAYAQYNISAITEIPALVGSFADTQGWDVDSTNVNQPIITHPTLSGAIPFRLTASIGGTNNQNHDLVLTAVSPPVTTSTVRTRSPKWNGSFNNPAVPLPTKLHVITGLLPEPYLIMTIEYGFNLYRHLYFGYMEKLGDYTGGEVISGQRNADTSQAGGFTVSYLNESHQYLFNGRHTTSVVSSDSGGVYINHADNANKWRVFSSTTSGTIGNDALPTFDALGVIGGFRDGWNDGYLARAKSSYSGAGILVPINLYVPEPITGDVRFIPIGHPAGVRLVHMQNLEPGQEITVGDETWKVFPAFSKQSYEAAAKGTYYAAAETSYHVGYAFLMEAA